MKSILSTKNFPKKHAYLLVCFFLRRCLSVFLVVGWTKKCSIENLSGGKERKNDRKKKMEMEVEKYVSTVLRPLIASLIQANRYILDKAWEGEEVVKKKSEVSLKLISTICEQIDEEEYLIKDMAELDILINLVLVVAKEVRKERAKASIYE